MSSVILIIDDDQIARAGLEAILTHHDYRLEMAASGQEGIEKALLFSPDIILLDVMMPGMDGFEVCRKIRSLAEIAEVPIIILTALDDQESLLKGLEAGADDFLSKPINRHELRARVRTITRLNRYRRLQHERERIRELAHQMINLQEEERRSISRELHDDLGQLITTMAIGLGLLFDELPEPAVESRDRVTDLVNIANMTIERVRGLSRDLRPPALDLVGLGPSLEGSCRDFSRRTNIPVRFSIEKGIPVLPEAASISLYRFLQEALTNILKHASASQVWVKLSCSPGWVHLSVRDDGSGFPQTTKGQIEFSIPRKDGSDGLGLLGMVERIAQLDGIVELDSKPGQGSRITAWIPVRL
jgi:signal transduction histidine kinase